MTPTLWLYEPGSLTPAGRVEVEGAAATLHDPASPSLGPIFDQLAAMPALPFVTEAWEGEGAAAQLVMRRDLVRPGEANWPHALAQAFERTAALTVRYGAGD